MAKTIGPAEVYVIGYPNGPCKIGMTKNGASRRLPRACIEVGSRVLMTPSILATRWHGMAFIIERFAHIYLQNLHVEGEWFAATQDQSIQAVDRAISFIARPAHAVKGWLARSGMSEVEAMQFFSTMPGGLSAHSAGDVVTDFKSIYWANQYATRHKRPRTFKHTTERDTEKFYLDRMPLTTMPSEVIENRKRAVARSKRGADSQ